MRFSKKLAIFLTILFFGTLVQSSVFAGQNKFFPQFEGGITAPVKNSLDSAGNLIKDTVGDGDGFDNFDTGREGTKFEDDGSSNSNTNNPFNNGLQQLQGSGLDPDGQLIPTTGQAANPLLWVMRMIMTLMTFVGIGTLIGILYGGFLYMTSGGESTQVDKAKRTLRNSVIGLVIILSSYSITWFIVTQVIDTTAAFGGGFILFNL